MQSNAALEYDYSVAKLFTYVTILFGFLGMLVGTIIAAQMAFPELNYLLGVVHIYNNFVWIFRYVSRYNYCRTNGIS